MRDEQRHHVQKDVWGRTTLLHACFHLAELHGFSIEIDWDSHHPFMIRVLKDVSGLDRCHHRVSKEGEWSETIPFGSTLDLYKFLSTGEWPGDYQPYFAREWKPLSHDLKEAQSV